MNCPQCGNDNRSSAKFCRTCGTKLALVCSSCGTVNEPSAVYCDNCGDVLGNKAKGKEPAPIASSQPAVVSSSSTLDPRPPSVYTPAHLAERIRAVTVTEGERKTITALFADIKGSTDLIRDLDPEDARAILDPALHLMMDAVHRYEGYVAQSMGDGIFALFGAPIAHEDHPQRALYAALRMQEESRKQAERLRREKGINLQLRVGINTGEVVLRSIRKDNLHTDYVPVGQSTNLAARMESLATPGSILVSAHTYKLTEGYFEFRALGPAQVKGFAEPIDIYEVMGVGPLRTRMQVMARRGLARFVGRQSELAHLQRALEQATAGHGQIVGVMGEPGVGKSRLVYEFKLRVQRSALVLETFSVSHGKAYAYLPLIECLKNYFQLTAQDDERTRREKITGRVLTLDRSLEEGLPYLLFLLGLAEPASPLQQMDPQIRRQRTLEAIKRLLIRESRNQPLILVFEDLHWLDAETQAFLNLLSDSVPTTRLLLLVNYRPEYQPLWGGKTYFTQLRLDPLGREQAAELLATLLGENVSSISTHDLGALQRLILDKTEGNPFFIEEIVQNLFEQGILTRGSGDGRETRRSASLPPQLQIPTSVQAVLAARIDRLPPEEKALLQTLAVIGKEFSLGLLRHVVEQPEEELLRLLSHLQAGEFIYEQPAFPDIEYTFKHALTQEVAYNSLLLERRKTVHERAAQTMEALFHATLADHYSDLAHHYSRSGNTPKAIDYLYRAGQQAVQRSAHAEAAPHFTAALEFLKTLPDTPERAQQELTLQLALVLSLRFMKGLTAPEVGAIHTRALELCQQIGETPQLFATLWGATIFYLTRAEMQTARELAERLMPLAQQAQDSALLLEAHIGLGMVLYSLGEWSSARVHFEHALALSSPGQQRATIAHVGADFGVISLPYLASILWMLGYPDQALARSRTGLSLARELAHPLTTSGVWVNDVRFYQFLYDARTVQQRAEALIVLCDEQGISALSTWAIVQRGWALAMQGQTEVGINQIHQALATFRATEAENWRPYYLTLLAETQGKIGQGEEGLAALAEALTLVDSTGEHMYEAEMYRLKGELTPQSQVASRKSQVEEAEACFLKAIEIARRQQAKSWELRASISLARLWQQQGNRTEAHNLLSNVYYRFTEGFDTKDLQEAKALMDELGEEQ